MTKRYLLAPPPEPPKIRYINEDIAVEGDWPWGLAAICLVVTFVTLGVFLCQATH